MRSLLKVGLAAAFAATLIFGNVSRLPAQPANEIEQLIKQADEFRNAGKYSQAIPLVQRILAIRERQVGPDHLSVAAWLNNLAVLYVDQGRYADAEPLHRRALAIREKKLDRDHPDVANSLNNLAETYRNQGRYSDAEPLYQRSLAIYEKVFGLDKLDVAAPLNNLAVLYRSQGRYADAEPLYRRSLAIYEKALGSDHPIVAKSLNNLAGLYESQGRYSDAEPLYQRSLVIYERAFGPEHPDIALALNNLAELYESQGRYSDAEPLYKRALAIFERALGSDHPDIALALDNLGGLYDSQGRYANAEPLFQRALTIRERALGRDHPYVANSLSNLAELYRSEGRYADAEPLYQRSLVIYEKALGGNHPYTATALNNLALLYQSQGRYVDAEPLLQRSLAIREKLVGRDHPTIATALNNLALLYEEQGRYEDSEPMYQRALAIREKAFGPEHPDLALSLNNLAALYTKEGRYADAEPLLKRSLTIREKVFGRDHFAVAQSLTSLALLYHAQSRHADAEPLLQRALVIQEKVFGPDHPDVARSLNNLATLYNQQLRYADALPIIRRAMLQRAARKFTAFPVLFASQAHNLINPEEALTDSYEIVQRASSSAAASAVSMLAVRFAAGSDELAQLVRKDQDLTAEQESLDKTVVAFVSKPPAQRSVETEEQVRKRIEAVKAERERLQKMFNERFPDYIALSKPQPVSLSETQALLADDEALLVFDFDAKSYAWIITRDAADWTELKISAADLDAQVRALRAWIVNPRVRFDPALAYKIYQETFAVFGDKIASKKRLSIVTNGALTSLPPQLLVTKDPSGKSLKEMDWLIRSHAITVLPSVASLKILRTGSQTSSARRPMIAFADPVFSKAARAQQIAMRSITSFYRGTQVDVAAIGEYLPQLPGTRREAQQIAAELKADAADVRLGLAATETAVKQAKLDQYRIVYFATHGLVAGDLETFAKDKAEPALALSIPEKPNDFDDGLLTASEIAQLKLDADWAVLSACNTAAEDKPGAEALSGLARTFFYAGARSLIVSHWSVSDEATARLMIGTFRASARDLKLSHAEALRLSTLAMIDGAKSDVEADPRLWAPFVVVGEPAKPQ
jgi:CHAT domain-containing protein/Tfp pilus assembly protein PilF